MKKYGLIGYPLGHSFSKNFFNEKFHSENIDAEYAATTDGRVYVDGFTAISPGLLATATDPFVDPYL